MYSIDICKHTGNIKHGLRTDPEVITFFMLNSAEHEIFSANEYENASNSWHFHNY